MSSTQQVQPVGGHRAVGMNIRESPLSIPYDNKQYTILQQGHQRSYPFIPRAQSIQSKDTAMLDMLDKMMGELQLLKEQTLTASASQPQLTLSHSGLTPQFDYPSIIHQDQRPFLQGQSPTSTYPSYQTPTPMHTWDQQHSGAAPRPVTTSLQYEPYSFHRYNQSRITSDASAYQLPYAIAQEKSYRGPTPTIPDLIRKDPGEFAQLKIALDNLLPPDGTV